MASFNPFEEVVTEDGTPFPQFKPNTSPPLNMEMVPMTLNPVTGHSYLPTTSNGIYPSLPGRTVEPSAPLPLPSGASGGYHSLPRTHHSSKLDSEVRVHRSKFDGDLLHTIANVAYTHSHAEEESTQVKRYNGKIDKAKNELNSYFNDLDQKLKDHKDKLLEELDSRHRHNVALIEKKEQEIDNLEKTEPVLLQNKGTSFEKLKEILSEQKRSLEAEIVPLTEIKLSYNPEVLEDQLNEIVSILPAPDSTRPVPRPRSKGENSGVPVGEKNQIESDSELFIQQSSPDRDSNTARPTTGPISNNVGMGDRVDQVQDPAGIAIDKQQGNVIYVADKEKHRVQVYDRSGGHLNTIIQSEKMRYPHSLALSNEFLFVLCAGRPEDKQYILRFDKMTGEFRKGLVLNDIRHTPVSVYKENIYIPTFIGIIEVFSVWFESCKKIEITVEKKKGTSIFSSGPEIRDICVNNFGIYLLVSNSENWIQLFDTDGKMLRTLAPNGSLNDARYFTVDNRGTVLVPEGKDGKIKLFKPEDKPENSTAIGQVEMGGEMENIKSLRGIDVDSHGKVVLSCAQNEWLLKEC